MSSSAGASANQAAFDPQMLFFLQQWLAAQQAAAIATTQTTPTNMTAESLQSLHNKQLDKNHEQRTVDYETLQMQLSAAVNNAHLSNTAIADLAQFQNPSLMGGAAAVQVGPTSSSLSITNDQGTSSNFQPEQVISLDASQVFVLPSAAGKGFFIQDKVTGSGMLIQGDSIYAIVSGQVVATGSLAALAHGKNLTINMQNGTKLTLVFDPALEPPVLDRLYISNSIDHSFAEMVGLQNGGAPLQINAGTDGNGVAEIMDYAIQDGTTLWMDPAGAALHRLDEASHQMLGVFGDPQALGLGMSASSFGGNIYNFFYSATDMGWHAYLNNGSTPGASAGQSGNSSSSSESSSSLPPGFDPGSGSEVSQSGLYVPPNFWKQNFGLDSIEDLIVEDFKGNPKAAMLEEAKKGFLKHQLKFGKMDMETKLMILLYLFIDDNNQDVDDLLKKLGYDKEGNPVDVTAPSGGWTPDNIDQAPIKVQMEFWGDYKAPAGAGTDAKQDIAFKKNQALQACGLDQSILQAQLTNMIRDRQQFIETVANATKVLDDTLKRIIDRII